MSRVVSACALALLRCSVGLLCCTAVLLQQLGCLVQRFRWPSPLPPRAVEGGDSGDVDNTQAMTTVVVVLTMFEPWQL